MQFGISVLLLIKTLILRGHILMHIDFFFSKTYGKWPEIHETGLLKRGS